MTPHPSLPGHLADAGGLADLEHAWPVRRREEPLVGGYLDVALETIVDPAGAEHTRTVVRPKGAVGVVVLDAEDRILLVEQYRHPVMHRLLELPAGTLDVEGEHPVDAAARELAEEADLVADDWATVLSLFATPGYSSEAWTVFRATSLRPVPQAERTERQAEEADMHQWWIPFDAAVGAVLDGRISDAMTVAAVLAEQVRRSEPSEGTGE